MPQKTASQSRMAHLASRERIVPKNASESFFGNLKEQLSMQFVDGSLVSCPKACQPQI